MFQVVYEKKKLDKPDFWQKVGSLDENSSEAEMRKIYEVFYFLNSGKNDFYL
jgi:hypothetical protein